MRRFAFTFSASAALTSWPDAVVGKDACPVMRSSARRTRNARWRQHPAGEVAVFEIAELRRSQCRDAGHHDNFVCGRHLHDFGGRPDGALGFLVGDHAPRLGVDAPLKERKVKSVAATRLAAGLTEFVELEAELTAKAEGVEVIGR